LIFRCSRFSLKLLSLVLGAGIFLGCPFALAKPDSEITVSAAISLKDVLNEIAQLYRVNRPSTEIHFNLGASGSLQLQIEQGAPVDIFISAAPRQMDTLKQEGLLLEGTRKDLVTNEVVLIVPRGESGIASFQNLTRPSVQRIAIGEPQAVPAGKYAQEILTHFGIYNQLKPKLVDTEDVRQVLTFVETGNVDAGIVYRTDALTSSKVTVVATAPEDSHAPVIYPVAIIRRTKNLAAAEGFENFLLGPKSSAIFRKYGFTPVSP
jgi:molybdate transport system substrate-binding protein